MKRQTPNHQSQSMARRGLTIVFFQYWPSRGTETYGVMCVTLTDTQELATYVIRTLQLQRVSSAHVRHPVIHTVHSHWQTDITSFKLLYLTLS